MLRAHWVATQCVQRPFGGGIHHPTFTRHMERCNLVIKQKYISFTSTSSIHALHARVALCRGATTHSRARLRYGVMLVTMATRLPLPSSPSYKRIGPLRIATYHVWCTLPMESHSALFARRSGVL
eukprot:7227377-Prymnesium_polylepis.1